MKRSLRGEASTDIDPADQARVDVTCPDPTLYPTHPQQGTKFYHRAQVARYRTFAGAFMSADDEACAIGQDRGFGGHEPRCLAPDFFYYRLASDTFMDGCGNFYRGFWETKYFRRDDNLGTLLSRGRTVREREGTPFPGRDFVPDGTYSLDPDAFVQLSPLFDGDLERIAAQQEEAEEEMALSLDAETCRFAVSAPQ